MENVMKMAGYSAAHAIWSVSSGEILIPIVGYLKNDDSREMERLVMGSAQAMAAGEKKLAALAPDTQGAVFIKDGMVNLETGKTDVLIIEIKFADASEKRLQLLIPYRNASHADGFAVHRLKLMQPVGIPLETIDPLVDAFVEGLESHDEGGKIWKEQYIDQAGVSTGYYGEENTDFSDEEYAALKKAPFLIFFLVAASDGKIDQKEATMFFKILSNPELLRNKLLNRIITNVINEIPATLAAMAQQGLDYIAELHELRQIAERRLPPDQAQEFKLSLLLLGKEIASASGGFLGFGAKISKSEMAALTAIALCLDINLG